MPFWRKLLYYGIGVFMGVLLVKFLFGWRDDIQCTYFPNDRVLYDMRLKEKVYTSEAKQQMNSLSIDTSDVKLMLNIGKVDFENSNTETEDSCKTYLIHHEPEESRHFSARLMNCDSTLYIMEFERRN